MGLRDGSYILHKYKLLQFYIFILILVMSRFLHQSTTTPYTTQGCPVIFLSMND